ncbi:hypothetical protein CASFOL_009694 [Castilleja foliolosa]|uniref:RNA-binding protein 48 n=1 Tax=Castilleja foliolosa TaxID=1961234 RepID=A0ABD3DUF2_9LAMI
MPKYKDEPPAVRVYTVCDESKYLIVRNVPSLGCGDELFKLFSTYGQVEECKPMDAEECDAYTDVYWIKFHQINNARFAKRKIDESVFLGNRLQVSYAPEYESLSDTKDKLEGRRKEVLARLNPRKSKGSSEYTSKPLSVSICSPNDNTFHPTATLVPRQLSESQIDSSNKDYFPSESMNRTVHLVREKLNKIQSNAEHTEDGSSKRKRVDNRRRI